MSNVQTRAYRDDLNSSNISQIFHDYHQYIYFNADEKGSSQSITLNLISKFNFQTVAMLNQLSDHFTGGNIFFTLVKLKQSFLI